MLKFDEPKLFPDEEEHIHLSDRQYRDIIPKKVETLCHRGALRILEAQSRAISMIWRGAWR